MKKLKEVQSASAMVFGQNVRRYRETQGMSFTALQYAAQLDNRQLRQIEAGTNNSKILTMERIADTLGVDMYQLFEREGSRLWMFPLATLQPAFDRLPLAEQGRVLSILRLLLHVAGE